MIARTSLAPDSLPRLAPHMRLRHDAARATWTIQAPERSFVLDALAHQVIRRCDGQARLDAIIDGLCADFPDAPREVIASDVTAMLQGLADKGVIAA